MAWNEIVANVKEKIRRGIGLESSGQEIHLADQGTPLERFGDAPIATPIVDIYENDKELLIHADVPGGTREGATIAWDEGRGLTLLVKSQGLPAGSIWASQYRSCDWSRTIELPEYVDGSRATSAIKDGVLTIRIPKRSAASKLIPVRAG